MNHPSNFVVATPGRSVCDDNARALQQVGRLRKYAIAARAGTVGIDPKRTALNPILGGLSYLTGRYLPAHLGESLRFRLNPLFDNWVSKIIRPGDNIISSYAHTNKCFKTIQRWGGKTFLDGGNSHPEHFWNTLVDEYKKWNSPCPPISRFHYERSLALLPHVDYVLSPSSFVTNSFLSRGFNREQIITNVYPVDLSCFTPAPEMRPESRPLTLISTGTLTLRKGTPYLLEAFRMVLREVPNARLMLTNVVADDVRPILQKYSDLPIDWAPPLPHLKLAERLRTADIFVLPSLEDGFARTVTEALACGLPVITTRNTGASDLVDDAVNGRIIPMCDSSAICEAVLGLWGDIQNHRSVFQFDSSILSHERFVSNFLNQINNVVK